MGVWLRVTGLVPGVVLTWNSEIVTLFNRIGTCCSVQLSGCSRHWLRAAGAWSSARQAAPKIAMQQPQTRSLDSWHRAWRSWRRSSGSGTRRSACWRASGAWQLLLGKCSAWQLKSRFLPLCSRRACELALCSLTPSVSLMLRNELRGDSVLFNCCAGQQMRI